MDIVLNDILFLSKNISLYSLKRNFTLFKKLDFLIKKSDPCNNNFVILYYIINKLF